MKIVKFGVINFSPAGKPIPEHFQVDFESAEEQKLYETDRRYFISMLMAAIAKHMNIESMNCASIVDAVIERDSDTFSKPGKGYDKSPEQIVVESLLRASTKHE